MKKAIIGSLAVIGGITVGFTVLVGIASAVQAARAKKEYENMTPEEREARKKRADAMLGVLLAMCNAASDETAAEESLEEVAEESSEAVAEATA